MTLGRPVSAADGVLKMRLTEADRRLLRSWTRSGTVPHRVVRRAHIVLLAADGLSAPAIARRLNVHFRTARLWSRRYVDGGARALWHDTPGRGRPRRLDDEAAAHLQRLLSTTPGDGRWTIRRLAAASGLSRSSVHRLLRSAQSG
jgi:transposase